MSELDPESSPLVEALRSEATGADARSRVRARLAAAGVLGAAAGAPALAAAQAAGVALVKPAGWLGLAKLVVLGTGALAVGTLAVVTVTPTRQSPSELAPRARPAAAPPQASAPPASVAPQDERAASESPAAVAPSQQAAARAGQPRAAHRAPISRPGVIEADAPAASTLAVESALLARAVRALSAGRAEEAHALLREHAERFPGGLLARERELALERLGVVDGP
jgi:hypothetical protein